MVDEGESMIPTETLDRTMQGVARKVKIKHERYKTLEMEGSQLIDKMRRSLILYKSKEKAYPGPQFQMNSTNN